MVFFLAAAVTAGSERSVASSTFRKGREGTASRLDHACIHVATSQPLEKEKEGHFRAKRRGKVLVEWPATEGGREKTKEWTQERTNERVLCAQCVFPTEERFQSYLVFAELLYELLPGVQSSGERATSPAAPPQ